MPITKYIWDPIDDVVMAETDEHGNVTVEYTHEPGLHGQLISQNRGGVESFYHYDGEGNTRALTDINGNVTDTYDYDAFGEVIASTGSTTNPFGYKGALGYYANPETNDYYVRARNYEPTIARWLSADPIGFIDSVNVYIYVRNDPVNTIDETGLLSVRLGNCFKRCDREFTSRRTNIHCRISRCYHCGKLLQKWVNRQEQDGIGWVDNLPACPCEMTKGRPIDICGRGQVINYNIPAGFEWDFGTKWHVPAALALAHKECHKHIVNTHPGAEVCIRSLKDESVQGPQPTQQCCYYNDRLITNGPGAGSPDINTPDHTAGDVLPWCCAITLDGGHYGWNNLLYQLYRPTNNAKGCPRQTRGPVELL